MTAKTGKSRVVRALGGLLCFVVLGYFSNSVMTGACERATSRWLNARLASHPSHWPHRRASHEPAEYRLPWIVAVDYEWVVDNTGGEWGTRYYLSLLGIPVPIRNHIKVQS